MIKNCDEIEKLIAQLSKLTEEERMEVFRNFCNFCGSDNPNCQCWNDE